MADRHRRRHARSAPVKPTVDDALTRWRVNTLILGACQIAMGAGYLFGSPASAPSLLLMGESGIPVTVWAGGLAIGGLLILIGRYPAGHALCALVCLVWAAFAVLVLVNGTATAWGWPWPAALCAMHGHGLYRSMRRSVRPPNSTSEA